MHFFRRLFGVLSFSLVIFANASLCSAYKFSYDWYQPKPMASTDEAIAAIKEMAGFVSLGGDVMTTSFKVDEDSLQITAAGQNQNKSSVVVFNQLLAVSQSVDLDKGFYGNVYFLSNNTSTSIMVDYPEHGRKIIDAVVTLALAHKINLVPYYDFTILTGSQGAIDNIIKKAKVPGGAVVHMGNPNTSLLTSNDVITQISYDGKVFPINNKEDWYAVCRDAVIGKPEETILTKVIRNGTVIEKEVKLINYGFNVTISDKQTTSYKTDQAGFGLMLQELSEEEAKTLGFEKAFRVVGVRQGSQAGILQIKPEDILTAINGVPITSAAQLQELSKAQIFSVNVLRAGVNTFLSIPLII
ncbi:MAG: hypothetical protein GX451_07655 [Acholeplasmataceae bacterium]|nr:hypothetical protein [Acholeplasmataceae bacterium]